MSLYPKRDIPRAIFLSIIIGATTMMLTGYLGVLASPHIKTDIHNLHWQQTALFYISKATGGQLFSEIYTAGFVLSMVVFNIVATAAGARLLYGMGRDHVLPACVFAKINRRFKTPHYNIIIIVLIECIVGLSASVGMISEMINFGALLGFALLNISIIVQACKALKAGQRIGFLKEGIFPFCGAVIMLIILVSMHDLSLIVGCSWLVAGILYGMIWSRGYRRVPRVFA